jgi:hypothetical protein
MIPETVSNAAAKVCPALTENIKAPEQACHHVVICVFESEAQSNETSDHEGRTEEDRAKSHFGLEMACMLLDVLVCDEIVQPVSSQLAQQGSNNWCEVKVANLRWAEVVKRCQEDRQSCIDPDLKSSVRRNINASETYHPCKG